MNISTNKSLAEVCFFIPIAIIHKADGSVESVRFFLFGNTNNRNSMIYYNDVEEFIKLDVLSGFTLDVAIKDVYKHYKTYGLTKGSGLGRGNYYFNNMSAITHLRSDGIPMQDVLQAVPKNPTIDVISLVNWKGLVRRVSYKQATAEMDTGILDGIGNWRADRLGLYPGSQYACNLPAPMLPRDAHQLDIINQENVIRIQNMPNLRELRCPASCHGLYIDLPYQTQVHSFEQLRLPIRIFGEKTAFVLHCHNYNNTLLAQMNCTGLFLNDIIIRQAVFLNQLKLTVPNLPTTDCAESLMRGYYEPGVCHCQIYLAPKLARIDLENAGNHEYTGCASLRLGGMNSLNEITFENLGVLELVLDDMYATLSDKIRIIGLKCHTLIIDGSYLLKAHTTLLEIDAHCESIIVRTTPRKGQGEVVASNTTKVCCGAEDRCIIVKYLKGETKISVDEVHDISALNTDLPSDECPEAFNADTHAYSLEDPSGISAKNSESTSYFAEE